MIKAGRPTDLTKELFVKIRTCVLNKMNLQETADCLKIPRDTLYGWSSSNYLDFAKKWEYFQEELLLELAGFNLKKVASMDTAKADGTEDPQLLKIQADVAKWTKETLNSERYNKVAKLEHTGSLNISVPQALVDRFDLHEVNK
jgi:hypothetical protein